MTLSSIWIIMINNNNLFTALEFIWISVVYEANQSFVHQTSEYMLFSFGKKKPYRNLETFPIFSNIISWQDYITRQVVEFPFPHFFNKQIKEQFACCQASSL